MSKEGKIKVLAYCDSPTCATGFGTVSRNILEALYKTGRYEINVLGINYWGDPHNFPYRIWPVGTNPERDPYGRKKICNMIVNDFKDIDIFFFLQDTFILNFLPELVNHLKANRSNQFSTICYYPIDGTPKEQWIKNISVVDYPITYSQFAVEESKRVFSECPDIEVVPHGVNTTDFFPYPQEKIQEFRKQYFGRHADKFIITNLNRNQQRKDIPRTIQAFKEFRKYVPDSILYLHMAMQDQGWDLPEVCASYGLNTTDDVIFPQNFGPNQGYPIQMVNIIYNISDVVVSSTLGEGWGLAWVEAMATKTPVIMPNNTAMTENITEDKGYLVDSGTNPSLFTVLPNDNEVIRPLVDVDDFVNKLLDVYHDRETANTKASMAYNWVVDSLDWQGAVGKKWVEIFDNAYEISETVNDMREDNETVIKTETL